MSVSVSVPVSSLPSPLEVQQRRVASAIHVEARGEIDFASAPELESELTAALRERPQRVVLDLAEVEFIDSAGVHLVLRTREAARERGVAFETLAPLGRAGDIFAICGQQDVLTSPARGDFITDWSI